MVLTEGIKGMRWFTSDWHFRHPKCAELRGFADCEAHDQALIESMRKWVRADDDLYFLGDMTLRDPAVVWALADQIPGRKIAVLGNHDSAHPMHTAGWKHVREWMGHFEGVTTGASIRLAGERVTLSHFPFAGGGDHTEEERHTQWRQADTGGYLLCGHVHDKWKQNGRMINVGVDVWNMEPVSEVTLGNMIKAHRERERQAMLAAQRAEAVASVA